MNQVQVKVNFNQVDLSSSLTYVIQLSLSLEGVGLVDLWAY